jgi:hypothetical protein
MEVKKYRVRGLIIYSLGLVLGLLFLGLVVWADLEASIFDSSMPAETRLGSLSCPIVLSKNETGVVSASFDNFHVRPVKRRIYAHISDGFVTFMRADDVSLTLDPGEKRKLEWPISAQDAAWNRLILVRIYSIRNTPLPSATGSCGIIVSDLPYLTGNQIVAGSVSIILLTFIGGFLLWRKDNLTYSRRSTQAGLAFLTTLVTAGILASLFGKWLLAGGLWLLAIILLATLIAEHFLSS